MTQQVNKLRSVLHLGGLGVSLLILLFLASCGTRKGGMSGTGNLPLAGGGEELVERLNAQCITSPTLSSRISFTIFSGAKQTSVGGTLKMRRNEMIQLSLTAMGLFEVGRLELTPQYLTIIDRMNHRYVQVSYADVPSLQQAGVSFFTFQSLFWNELFLFDGQGTQPSAKQFAQQLEGSQITLTNADNALMELSFLADMTSSVLTQTRIASKQNTYNPALQMDYQNFQRVEEKDFPTSMTLQITGTGRNLKASISLSNIKTGDEAVLPTDISKRYTQISLQEVLNILTNLQM